MKQLIVCTVFVISALLAMFSCKNTAKVRIFVSWPGGEGMPHYTWKKGDSKPTGIEPKFIERLLEVAELDYEYITDFEFSGEGDPRIESLIANKADISIRAISINPEREKLVLFTNPYYYDGLTALVRKSDSLKTLSDLNQKRVYTLEFTSAHSWAQENLNSSTLMTYEKFDTAFIEPEGLLLENKIDGYVLDKSFLKYIAMNQPALEVMQGTFTEEKIGIAVSKLRPELVEKLNRAIQELKDSGE